MSGPAPRADGAISFEPVGREHLGLLRGWFSEPHVRAWWGEPDEEVAAVVADLDGVGSGFAMWVAHLDGVPFAYLQDGDPGAAEEPYYADPPDGARCVDLLIGAPSHVGRGLAPPLLRAFAAHAAGRGARMLLIDPDAANAPAVAAYRRAGFEETARHREGPKEIIVMHLTLTERTP